MENDTCTVPNFGLDNCTWASALMTGECLFQIAPWPFPWGCDEKWLLLSFASNHKGSQLLMLGACE